MCVTQTSNYTVYHENTCYLYTQKTCTDIQHIGQTLGICAWDDVANQAQKASGMITRCCHTWVKQDQTVASNEIEPTASSFAAEQEDKLVLLGVIEVFDQLLALVDAGTAIQSHKGILKHSQTICGVRYN